MSDTPKPTLAADIRKNIHAFLETDGESVDQFNNLESWKGHSTERTLEFLSWRLLHTKDFFVHLSNVLAEHMEATSETSPKG